MALKQYAPDVYDSTAKVHRPMIAGEAVSTDQIPLSVRPNNQLVAVTGDGLYVGPNLDSTVYYVNSSGTDAPTSGSKATPYKTLDYALAQLTAKSPGSRFKADDVTVALAAGQTFTMNADMNIYGGQIAISFYGDAQYGDFNSPAVGTGAQPAWMADLNRPTIVPGVSNVSAQWYLAGFNRYGGNVVLRGVKVNLPAAPASPSITLYSMFSDFVRNLAYAMPGHVILTGSIINMSDTNSYWGICGTHARSTMTTLTQFASQFTVNGRQLSSTNNPTAAELTARQYFVKMYADLPGNSGVGALSATAQNSSVGSGILNLSWSDTEALVVATGKTNLASFPIGFDVSYGFRNYVYGLTKDQQSRALNVISPRLF